MNQHHEQPSTFHDRAALRPALQVIREMLPHGLLERQDEVVGCWYVTDVYRPRRNEATTVTPVLVQVHGVLRTVDSRMVGVRRVREVGPELGAFMEAELGSASTASRRTDRTEAATSFVIAMREMVDTLDDPEELFFECTYPKMQEHVGEFPPEEGRDAGRVVLDERKAVLREFAGTLDPAALALLRTRGRTAASRVYRHDLDSLLGEAWPMLDATFGRGAPLRAVLSLALQTDTGLAVDHLRKRLGRGTHWGDLREQMSQEVDLSAARTRDRDRGGGPDDPIEPRSGP